eukprot:TRINITY_DN9390_c0_g2_i1.p2 TRINITY_DN9390_c0_g2~~TRINITY_DN9390_c0_g2_i1.p2  ORF type:complete len:145 (+),score=39.61 TRINITY_DN9390_c0_g2_i1:67-501(+)
MSLPILRFFIPPPMQRSLRFISRGSLIHKMPQSTWETESSFSTGETSKDPLTSLHDLIAAGKLQLTGEQYIRSLECIAEISKQSNLPSEKHMSRASNRESIKETIPLNTSAATQFVNNIPFERSAESNDLDPFREMEEIFTKKS